MFRRIALALVLWTMLAMDLAHAETVIARRRLGNNVEGLTYDPLNDRAYAMDGNDVIAIALNPLDAAVLATMHVDDGGISGIGFRKVFDLLRLDPRARTPNGLVYVPTQHRFYFSSVIAANATVFFSADETGRPLPNLNLKGLGDTADWLDWEGLAWIPPGAPVHGGTIAGLGHREPDEVAHVFFIRLDGTVEAELVPQPGSVLERYFCGIQYWPQHPGVVLLTDCGVSGTYAMDIRTGTPVGDPSAPLSAPPDQTGIEGVIVRKNGQILESGYQTGRLYAYDSTLRRTPGEDRLFVVGIGVTTWRIGWNPDAAEFLALTPGPTRVYAIAPDLLAARWLFNMDVNHESPNANGGIQYLGSGQIGIGNRGDPNIPRGIDVASLVDPTTGYSLSRLLFTQGAGFPAGQPGTPAGFGAYGVDKFLVNFVGGDHRSLGVVSRGAPPGTPNTDFVPDGIIPVRYPDLTLSVPTQGWEAQVFDSGSGPRIFTGAEIYDINGNLLHVIDSAKIGIQDPPLKRGVWLYGNTFAAEDGRTSTIIVYTVP
jgi:hypothetical protein